MLFPEHTSKNVTLTLADPSCPTCLKLLFYSLTVGANLILSSTPVVSTNGLAGLTVALGDVLNLPDQSDTSADRLVVHFCLVLRDVPAVVPGMQLEVSAQVAGEGGSTGFKHSQSMSGFVEEKFVANLWASAAEADAGDLIVFQLRLLQVSLQSAYHLSIHHTLHSSLALHTDSLRQKVGSGNWAALSQNESTAIAVNLAAVPAGTLYTLEFKAEVKQHVRAGTVLPSSFRGDGVPAQIEQVSVLNSCFEITQRIQFFFQRSFSPGSPNFLLSFPVNQDPFSRSIRPNAYFVVPISAVWFSNRNWTCCYFFSAYTTTRGKHACAGSLLLHWRCCWSRAALPAFLGRGTARCNRNSSDRDYLLQRLLRCRLLLRPQLSPRQRT